MRKGLRRWSTVATSALVMIAAACGSDDKNAAADGNAGTANAAAATNAVSTAAATTDSKANWPKKLTFSVVPGEQNVDLSATYKPVLDLLKEKTGVQIDFFQATDYNGVIEGMISGKVDLAEFGPFSYVLAKTNGADIAPIGVQVTGVTAPPGYQSYGIVRSDSTITDLAGYKGKKVCFVDPGSTSGFLYPSAGLIKAGLDPQKDVTPTFAGGHDLSVLSIKDKTCDAGFAFDTMVDKTLIEKGSIKAGDIKVIWKSEIIPGSPLAMSNKLPASLQTAIKDVILKDSNKTAFVKAGKCTDEANCKVTSDKTIWGYVSTTDSYYDPIRSVCSATKAAKCTKG
ncbi:MAG: phosphate/phosphite/phosphonate ABC transporter substrate-binding protein [Acidimicrobiia bacterium]